MDLATALKLLLLASVMATVFSMALRARASDALYLFRHPALGIRAFLVMFVIVPAFAIGMALAFDLTPAVKVAIVALAFSPVPPILPRKQMKSGGAPSYVTGLLVAASLASVVMAPLGIALAGWIHGVEAYVAPTSIARVLLTGIGGPLVAGLICARLLGDRADRLSVVIRKVATITLVIAVIGLLIGLAPAVWAVIGNGTILALLALILFGLGAGYALAGGERDEKSALALAASARHPGVVMTIASEAFPGHQLAAAAVVLFTLLSMLVSVPLLRLINRSALAAPKGSG